MANKINTISELRIEKDRLKALGDEQLKEVKSSLNSVKSESKNVLINKILIPAGITLLVGYGVKKIIDAFQSNDNDAGEAAHFSKNENDSPNYHRSEVPQKRQKSGFLSNVDWSATAVKLMPFVLSVGRKLYEEGSLPFIDPPSEPEQKEEA